MAKILVVDDQESVLKTAEALLTKNGYDVTLAKDGYEALEKVSDFAYDMIITDAIMPGISGWDLVNALRKIAKTKDLPIVMMTARKDRRDVKRAIEVHIDDYIVKPIDPDTLIAKIKALLLNRVDALPKPEVQLSEKAEVKFDVEIVAISESGLKLEADFSAHVGLRVPIFAPLFQSLGVQHQSLRVLSCTPRGNRFLIHAEFVDISSADLEKVRGRMAPGKKAG